MSVLIGGVMGFIKDGETKVYKDKIVKNSNTKQASQTEKIRYTVDDLVRDSKDSEEDTESGEDNVSY
jgi:hypothetical protein